MAKPKTLEQLRAEKEQAGNAACTGTAQAPKRLENRGRNIWRKANGKKRTHRLCNLGGTIESLAPEVKDLDTHRNDRADGTHLFSVRSPASRPSHGDYSHQPSEQRKGVESRWHYFI